MSKRRKRQVRMPSPVEGDKGSTSSESRRSGSRFDFNPDYSYVRKDLRRIGLLTGVFLSVLVVLSFILR